jgi:hypothetical protein
MEMIGTMALLLGAAWGVQFWVRLAIEAGHYQDHKLIDAMLTGLPPPLRRSRETCAVCAHLQRRRKPY